MTTERSAPNPTNPFVGLRPFRTEESLLFFGRNEQTVELLQQLHRTRFLAVVGSSGCGKSSLIRAGLIPKLKAGFLIEDRDRWLTATMKPGDSPLRNLATALLEATFGDTTEAMPEAMVDDFVKAIRQSGAETITTRLAAKLGDASSNLLLLVDQFEEIFRFGVESNKPDQREEAEDFVSLMLALAEQRTLPIYVVMTMRSDFIGDCDNFYGLPEAMNRSQYLVPRLTRQQRQQAIEGPIRLFGANITPRLLDRVLNDVGDKSDQLPVMQHALMRTWEQWQKSAFVVPPSGGGDSESEANRLKAELRTPLDVEYYEAVGTLTEALSRDAEAALAALSEENQKIAERMFQALTDTDARNRQIRRPAHLSELCAITGTDRQTIETIIEEFSGSGRSFLTQTNEADPLIDISHESFIRQWGRLGEWMRQESISREIYLRMVKAAIRRKDIRANLWSGADLQEALAWREGKHPTRSWAERYDPNFALAISFLNESQKAEEESRCQKEAAAKEIEERRRRELRRTRTVAVVIGTAFLLAAITAWFAWQQRGRAIEQEKIAKEQEHIASQLNYAANMNLAQEAFEKKDSSYGYELLNAFLPTEGTQDRSSVREFSWYYRWFQNHQELATLNGHESYVWSVAFAPDGKTIASASHDKTVKLWDTLTGQSLDTLKGHEAEVWSVAFAPDGKTLVSASYDKTVKFWDARTGQNLATLKGHENSVSSVAFAPDGKTLASASYDETVKLWDARTGQNLATLKGHEGGVSSVAFAPDGKTLASAGVDNTVKLWDAYSGNLLNTLKGHEGGVSSVAFAPDGKTLASASEDNTVKLWDSRNGQLLNTLKGHEGGVNSVSFSPDSSTLASASYDKTVKLWDARSGQLLNTLRGHEANVISVNFVPDGKTLASSSNDNTVKLWDARSGRLPSTLSGHESFVNSVAFSPDSSTLASASYDTTVKLWDACSGQLLNTLKGHEGGVRAVTFAPDGKTLASASDDNTVKLWDTRSGQLLNNLKGHGVGVWSVAFAPDGKTLASASLDQTIRLWDVQSGQITTTLEGHEDYVLSVAFAPDGKMLASASHDKTVKLWDARNGKLLNTLNGHEAQVKSVAFAPDGKTLASASWDNTVKLWDAYSGHLLNTLKGHEAYVRSVAFAPDGRTLASASRDKTVKLWDARTGQLLNNLKGHEDSVLSVAFAPDGKTLASAEDNLFRRTSSNKDFVIRLWRAATDADVERQRNR